MWDLNLLTSHQVPHGLHGGEELYAVAPTLRPQFVFQFTDFTTHLRLVPVPPNCGRYQSLTRLGTAVRLVDIHGVVCLHVGSLWCVSVYYKAKLDACQLDAGCDSTQCGIVAEEHFAIQGTVFRCGHLRSVAELASVGHAQELSAGEAVSCVARILYGTSQGRCCEVHESPKCVCSDHAASNMLAGTFHRPWGVATVTYLIAILFTVPCTVRPVLVLVNCTGVPIRRLFLTSLVSWVRAHLTASIILDSSTLVQVPNMIAELICLISIFAPV